MQARVYYDIACDVCHRSASSDFEKGFFHKAGDAIKWAQQTGWKTRGSLTVCPTCAIGFDFRKSEVHHTVRCPNCGKLGGRLNLTLVQHGDGVTCAHTPERVWEKPVPNEELKHHAWYQMTQKGDEAPVGVFLLTSLVCTLWTRLDVRNSVQRVQLGNGGPIGMVVVENDRGVYALFSAGELHQHLLYSK